MGIVLVGASSVLVLLLSFTVKQKRYCCYCSPQPSVLTNCPGDFRIRSVSYTVQRQPFALHYVSFAYFCAFKFNNNIS